MIAETNDRLMTVFLIIFNKITSFDFRTFAFGSNPGRIFMLNVLMKILEKNGKKKKFSSLIG